MIYWFAASSRSAASRQVPPYCSSSDFSSRKQSDRFGNPIVDKGYVLALNPQNPVSSLSAQEIKNLFDEEITNWKEVGGPDLPVKVFRLEDLDKLYTEAELGAEYERAGEKITEQVEQNPGIIAFIPEVLVKPYANKLHLIKDETIPVKDVLLGTEWFPTATPLLSSVFFR